MIYRFKGSKTPTERSQIVGEALDEIRRNSEDGVLRPSDVVEDSRPMDAPLHGEFEWDDSVAANEHRKLQARQLISLIVEVPEQAPAGANVQEIRIQEPRPAFTHLRTEKEGYRPTIEVLSDALQRAALIEQARADYKALHAKYKHLTELAKAFEAFEAELERVEVSREVPREVGVSSAV